MSDLHLYLALDEQERSERAALSEDMRECIYCNADISAETQEKNGGACNSCADRAEHAYWEAAEAGGVLPPDVPF